MRELRRYSGRCSAEQYFNSFLYCYLNAASIFIVSVSRYIAVAGLGFFGLNFNVGNLTGSVYANNVVSG